MLTGSVISGRALVGKIVNGAEPGSANRIVSLTPTLAFALRSACRSEPAPLSFVFVTLYVAAPAGPARTQDVASIPKTRVAPPVVLRMTRSSDATRSSLWPNEGFGPDLAEQADLLATLTREEVVPVDEAHPVATGAHDERVSAGAVGEEANAAEQVAVRHARRDDDHLPRSQLLDREDAADVFDPGLVRLVDVAPRDRPELRAQLAAEAAKRRRGEHRLPRAADADREVVVRPPNGGRDRRGDVTVLDQLDPGACGADLLDQVLVARPVEDDRRHVLHRSPERACDRADVLADGPAEVDAPPRDRADGHLPHVHVRELHQRAALTDRQHRHRAVPAARHDAPALERVEREIDLLATGADLLADRERRAALRRADHDPPRDREQLERVPHPGERGLLRTLLVRPSEPARARERGALGRAGERLARADAAVGLRRLRLGPPRDRLDQRSTPSPDARRSTARAPSPCRSSARCCCSRRPERRTGARARRCSPARSECRRARRGSAAPGVALPRQRRAPRSSRRASTDPRSRARSGRRARRRSAGAGPGRGGRPRAPSTSSPASPGRLPRARPRLRCASGRGTRAASDRSSPPRPRAPRRRPRSSSS